MPIKETPILYGEDAERFKKACKKPEYISDEEFQRMKKTYEEFKKKGIAL